MNNRIADRRVRQVAFAGPEKRQAERRGTKPDRRFAVDPLERRAARRDED